MLLKHEMTMADIHVLIEARRRTRNVSFDNAGKITRVAIMWQLDNPNRISIARTISRNPRAIIDASIYSVSRIRLADARGKSLLFSARYTCRPPARTVVRSRSLVVRRSSPASEKGTIRTRRGGRAESLDRWPRIKRDEALDRHLGGIPRRRSI